MPIKGIDKLKLWLGERFSNYSCIIIDNEYDYKSTDFPSSAQFQVCDRRQGAGLIFSDCLHSSDPISANLVPKFPFGELKAEGDFGLARIAWQLLEERPDPSVEVDLALSL